MVVDSSLVSKALCWCHTFSHKEEEGSFCVFVSSAQTSVLLHNKQRFAPSLSVFFRNESGTNRILRRKETGSVRWKKSFGVISNLFTPRSCCAKRPWHGQEGIFDSAFSREKGSLTDSMYYILILSVFHFY